MMKFQSLIIFAVLALVPLCSSHIGGMTPFQETNPQIYCGRTLARALAVLCYGADALQKRSDSGTMYGGVLSPYYKPHRSQEMLPWMSSYKAMGMETQRGKRLIVSECCDKACTLNELLDYC